MSLEENPEYVALVKELDNHNWVINFFGKGGSGKTTLLDVLGNKAFRENTPLSIGMSMPKVIKIGGNISDTGEDNISILVLDYGGQIQFKDATKRISQNFQQGKNFVNLVAFNTANPYDFSEQCEFMEMSNPGKKIILLGTQVDLADSETVSFYTDRFNTMMCENQDIVHYIFTSAKDRTGVDELKKTLLMCLVDYTAPK